MAQKIVSFKVAKAIKESGYPQYGSCEEFYDANGKVVDKMCDMHKLIYPCPTYLDVWLWLCREKNCYIQTLEVRGIFKPFVSMEKDSYDSIPHAYDLEDAIENAIEYLVDNDLIK